MRLHLASLIAFVRAAVVMPLAGQITKNTETEAASCGCHDPELDLLRALIDQGFDQWHASLIVFGGTNALPAGSPSRIWRLWARNEARRIGNDARRALGLAEQPRIVEGVR